MPSRSALCHSFLVAVLSLFVSSAVFAHDVTISGVQSFASLDGSASDHDGAADGVFTVDDGNLVVNGIVNCNDDSGGDNACAMAFVVSGNLTVGTSGALYAENRSGGGTGGSITLTVGGNLTLNGNAIVSTASKSSSGSHGGVVTANVGGAVSLDAGSTIDSGSANAIGGAITITAGNVVNVAGNVLSGPSRTLLSTRLGGGAALSGGTSNTVGGAITIGTTTFAEPALVIASTANVISEGSDGGAGPVTIDGCGVQVYGLVAALSRKAGAAVVRIRSGKDVLVDGRDLGAAGTRMGRIRADAPTGTALNKGIDIFASETIDLFGPASGMYTLTSLPGLHDSKSFGGKIRVISIGDVVNGSGNLIDDGHTASGDSGGSVEIRAKGDVALNTAVIRAVGDFNTNNPNRGGGSIVVRSYSGDVIWTNGVGEVRPVGSTSNLAVADQGSITLTACGSVDITGSTFPVMGVATSPLPTTQTGVCSEAAPLLPLGVPPLVTCNTPPVANDTNASTNEDTTVTILLSGSDADGDSLTFAIVSGPANGSLGPVISTGPTTASVDYTPNLNYNGADAFVFEANDGNGGTDDATATISIAAVNDAPSFLTGPSVTALEDSGAQTYPGWVSAISPGPADEAGQSVTFSVTNDNPSLFSVQPSVASDGTLTFTPAANAYGSATVTVVAHDDGGTASGGVDTSAPQTSSIAVTAVNDEPSFAAGGDQSVNEDAGPQSVAGWANSISAGPNESGQSLTFVVSNDNNALFSAQPAVSATGTLTFATAADANGSATVTLHLQDDGGTANGGDDTSPNQTFTITVSAVNDAPSFTSGGDISVLEDQAAYSASWATDISAGPADELGQAVTFGATNDNNSLFSVQPAVASDGTLTFTLAPDAYGVANVTLTLSDDGGTANGGADTSAPQTFVIDVLAVNDEPSFTSGGDVSVTEDSGAYSAAWATGISAGPNESGQTLTFVTITDDHSLFLTPPSVDASGLLTFSTAPDAFGTANVSIYLQDDGTNANGGDDTSPTVTVTVTLRPVNDAPSFAPGSDAEVAEDSGAYSAPWATSISAGPANEASQVVTFVITANTNTALFSVQPALASDGTLTFTPATNATGSAAITVHAQDNGGTADGGVDLSGSFTFSIEVTGVNDPPTFTAGPDVTSFEDAGPYSASWASDISAGPGEGGQTLTFTVTNDNNALFSIQPSIDASGELTYTSAPNANGTATVTVVLQDDGGGADTSSPATFTITVVAVNDAPSFTPGGDVSVLEDSAAYSAIWATSISTGPADESGQTITFGVVSNSNPSLFAVSPSIAPDGTLSFTPAANAFGSATITVDAQDDGGTANGGTDSSASVTFTIIVAGVNDAPSFVTGGNVTVNEDNGPYSAAWASSINAGPNEAGQTVSFAVSNDNTALFSAQPSISGTGVLSFTPAPNAFGTATVSVFAQDDGGTANGGVDISATLTFIITVNSINDPPTAENDSWETEGNTELRVDLAPGMTPFVGDTTTSGTGVLDNDADAVEGDPISITGVVGCADAVAPYDCAVTGGTISLSSNGSLRFLPSAGATGGSFQYTITDGGASATGTVSITIHDMIWYVNGSAPAGGNGTSSSPFNDFVPLTGAGDADGPGAYLFVHNSTVAGPVVLEGSQKLWGEGVGLLIPRNLNGNGNPSVIVAPGTRPTILATGDTIRVNGETGVEIAGLNLLSSSGDAIEVTSPLLGAASATIFSNEILGAGQQGIDVNGLGTGGTIVWIDETSVTSSGNAVDVSASAGTVVFGFSNGTITSNAGSGLVVDGSAADILLINGLSNVTITGNTAGDGVSITAARFDANPATAAVDTLAAGLMNAGSGVNPVGGTAVALNNVSGDLAFDSLNAHGTAGGLVVAGSGLFTGAAGFQLGSGGGAASAAGGPGVSIANASISGSHLTLSSVSASGGTNGIILNNTGSNGGLKVTGDGSAGSGGTIQNTTGHGISLTSTASPEFHFMSIQNSGGSGVKGTLVTNFTFNDGSIDGSGTALGVDESNIAFNTASTSTERNVSGTVTIARNQLTNAYYHAVDILNFDGTLAGVTIVNNTMTSTASTATSKGSAIRLLAFGSATTAANVTAANLSDNVITNFPSGAGIVAHGGNTNLSGPAPTFGMPGNAGAKVTISGNTIAGSGAQRMGTNAIATSVNGQGQGNFDISDNGSAAAPLTNIAGTVIVNSALGQAIVTARIAGNVIDANHVSGFGGPVGISAGAAQTFAATDAPQYTVEIVGNTVMNTDGNGILAAARSSAAVMKARVVNNTVGAPLSGFRQGIRVDSGTSAGNTNLCLEITGNTSAGSGGALGIGLRKQGTNPAVNVFGIVGMAATGSPGVESYVDSANPTGGGTQLLSATTGFVNCSLP